MSRILFFTEISPFPINRGERIRSYGLLKALSELGYNVCAVINNEENLDLKSLEIKGITFIELPKVKGQRKGIGLFKRDTRIDSLFHEIIKRDKPDLAFLDYAFIGQYIPLFKKNGIPVLYGTHNAQADLTRQQPVKGLKSGLLRPLKIKLQEFHERFYFSKADQLIVVSPEDQKYHSSFVSEEKIHIVPNFLDEKRYPDQTAIRKNYFVMTANFKAYMNFEGLRWLLSEVWDNNLDRVFSLKIVGSGSKEALQQAMGSSMYRNVTAYGTVDDIQPYIAQAQATLIPLLHGSGSRLKCLEAMALRTPIISTQKGIEGIKSDYFVVADNAKDFKKALLDFQYDKKSAEHLYRDFIEHYSVASNKHKLAEIIEKTINR